ncbi:hypothetical protein [Candidatus Mycoplasma haematohominis]|uniref:Uncharacterized protein n=1 Tax=Candidatus Mycoplasma haematohominis TaxID=1494318 RepID=A0A478FPW4_9MOLU|nr:hypothetical protein [Candidatus Mycoplasma haemohominis]GCE63292.1 hypothetical protein MHSWG343_02790 [Candidatus Mycoplasma haemohominis]
MLGWRVSTEKKKQQAVSRYLRHKSNDKYRKYSFREFNEGYLIYKNSLNPFVRKTLNLFRLLIKWIIDKRNENRFVNKKIFAEIGLPEDTDLDNLDAFYRKEFRKKKYIYFFKDKPHRDLREPPQFLCEYIPKKIQSKSKKSASDFFKTFEK